MNVGDAPLLLLAAGRGQRFGMPKALWPIDGRALVRAQLERFAAVGGEKAVVVLGPATEPARELLDGLPLALLVTSTPAPEDGPFASLRHAIATALSWSRPACWVLPVDVPAAAAPTFRAMVSAFEKRPDAKAVSPVCEGRGGHPVLLEAEWARSLLELDPRSPEARLDVRLRALDDEGTRVRVPTEDRSVLLNLNTKEAAEAFARAASFGIEDELSSRRNS